MVQLHGQRTMAASPAQAFRSSLRAILAGCAKALAHLRPKRRVLFNFWLS
jgi:hypothetical protein